MTEQVDGKNALPEEVQARTGIASLPEGKEFYFS